MTPQEIPARPFAIAVHIDTLVVDGLVVRNAAHLGVVVQNQLQSMLEERGLGRFAQGVAPGAHLKLATLRAPAIRASRVPHASDIGERIAGAIHGGLRA